MAEITNYLNTLNKRIEINSSEISNVELKESFVLNSRRVASDLSSVGAYLNDVIVKSFSELCSRPRYPHDTVANGLSGMTMVTWPESLGNNRYNSNVFWFDSENPDAEGRPCTIKESIQYLWENLNDRIIEVRSAPPNLNGIYDSLNCMNTKLERLKIDTFGSSFILNCEAAYTKQKWSVSRHVYEILTRLTSGHNEEDLLGLKNSDEIYPEIDWAIELSDLLDVSFESGAPRGGDSLIYNEESETWEAGNADVKWIDELYDVDTTNPNPVENDILVWDPHHKDSQGSGEPEHNGAWTPKSIEDLITIPSAEQRLGALNIGSDTELIDRSSTLEDVVDFKERFEQLETDISSDPSNAAGYIASFFRDVNKKHRPGSLLHFNGFDKWYSNLGGNTSNLNALNYIPETFSKNSVYLENLSSTDRTQKSYGGSIAIPFVFVNSFRKSYKELLDTNFERVLLTLEFDQADTNGSFSPGIFEAILGDDYDNSRPKLSNEIEFAEKINSLAMTSTNTLYTVGTDLHLEYSPNFLLGVSRTDLSKFVESESSSSEEMFIASTENSDVLTGEVNQNVLNSIRSRVFSGRGSEVQHSGYTKVMCLGPHEIGDNVYLCPEPLLHIFGIKYPYGVVISDTFITTSIENYIDRTGILAESGVNVDITQYGMSMYAHILQKLSELSSTIPAASDYFNILADASFVNNMKANPVGFITKKEGMKESPYMIASLYGNVVTRTNLSDKICRNLMGPCAYTSLSDYSDTGIDSASGQIQEELQMIAMLIGFALTQAAGAGSAEDFTDVNNQGYKIADKTHELYELHLPTIKIQLPGFKYNSSFLGVKGDAGTVGPAGPQGPTGAPGTPSVTPGPTGPQGVTGPVSVTPGPVGATGPEGPASTIAGPKGSTGPKGDPGDPAISSHTIMDYTVGGIVKGDDGNEVPEVPINSRLSETLNEIYSLPITLGVNVVSNILQLYNSVDGKINYEISRNIQDSGVTKFYIEIDFYTHLGKDKKMNIFNEMNMPILIDSTSSFIQGSIDLNIISSAHQYAVNLHGSDYENGYFVIHLRPDEGGGQIGISEWNIGRTVDNFRPCFGSSISILSYYSN